MNDSKQKIELKKKLFDCIALYDKQKFVAAQKLAQKILLRDENNFFALTVLGNVFFKQHKFADSLFYYLKAFYLKKQSAMAAVNLANAYFEMKDFDKCILYATKTLAADKKNITAYSLLGNAFLALEKFEQAVLYFKKALLLNKNDAWLHNYLSQAYQKSGKFLLALKAGFMAVKIAPNESAHAINFGYLLYEVCNENLADEAKKYALKWRKIAPQNANAQYVCAAILSEQKMVKANQKYVADIFDVFAADFENVLTVLKYSVPKVFADLLQKNAQKIGADLCVLDAGCGTGFCAEFLQKYAKKNALWGVDLSAEMLKIAAQKNIYAKLYNQELEIFLSQRKNKFDLICAADVLTYFGDLKNVFSAVASALHKNGKFIFSVSENKLNQNDYFLHPSGRFLHGKKYVENVLLKCGFSLISVSRQKLRIEGDSAVWGYVVLATKKPL